MCLGLASHSVISKVTMQLADTCLCMHQLALQKLIISIYNPEDSRVNGGSRGKRLRHRSRRTNNNVGTFRSIPVCKIDQLARTPRGLKTLFADCDKAPAHDDAMLQFCYLQLSAVLLYSARVCTCIRWYQTNCCALTAICYMYQALKTDISSRRALKASAL